MEAPGIKSGEETPLVRRLSSGIGWVALTRVFLQVAGVIRLLVIARLLGPNDYGLFGISLLALSALETLSRSGFDVALVQKRGNIVPYLDMVWTIQVVRGAVLAIALFFSAPYIASFFREPRSEELLMLVALVPLLRGFANVSILQFQRDIEFRKRAVLDIGSNAANVGVSLVLAFLLGSVEALIIGVLAGTVVHVVLSYVLALRWPRFSFSITQFRALRSFAGWTWVQTFARFAAVEGDDILVGRLLGADVLGLYRMAYRISNLITTEITDTLSTVLFPAHAELAGRPGSNKALFLKTLRFIALISVPATLLLIFTAEDLTRVLLGSEWLPMVATMQILAVWGLDRSLIATVAPALQGSGDARGLANINLLRVSVLFCLIYPLTLTWQTEGTAVAVIISGLVADSYGFRRGFSLMECRWMEGLQAVLPAMLAGAIMLGTVITLHTLVAEDAFVRLLITGLGASLAYLLACLWIDTRMDFGLRSDVSRFLKGWAT